MRPLIGVTCGLRDADEREFHLGVRYVESVRAAGGLPVIIPVMPRDEMEDLLLRLGGLVVIGGPDLPPDLYGEEDKGSEKLVPRERAEFDLALIRAAVERDMPVLGICYGCQAINVAFGGKLIQDIPSQVERAIQHRKNKDEDMTIHEVRLDSTSRLARILGSDGIESASSHHQSISVPADGFRVVAHAPDGIVEAMEREDKRFLFALQWHPEMTPEAEHSRRVFRALVEAAGH